MALTVLMSIDETSGDDITEKIKILATDDEKIKSFGEILTNNSSREIMQLLYNEELSANQIAQKTDISLQLVKYHLTKLQDLGIVKILKIEKNSKSQDMKIPCERWPPERPPGSRPAPRSIRGTHPLRPDTRGIAWR